jgi:hypothetical protein
VIKFFIEDKRGNNEDGLAANKSVNKQQNTQNYKPVVIA